MSFAWHSGMAKIWFCSIDCDGPPALAGLWTDPVTCCPWVLTPSSSWWLPKGANRVAQRLLAFERQPTRDGLRPQTWGWGLREEVVSVSQRSDDEGNYNREKRPGETRCVCVCVCVCVCMRAQSRPPLCDRMDCSLPSSSVHGIFQEWIAFSFSRTSSWPTDLTPISCLSDRFFTTGPPAKPWDTMMEVEIRDPGDIRIRNEWEGRTKLQLSILTRKLKLDV